MTGTPYAALPLVHFDGPLPEAWLARLVRASIDTDRHLPARARLVFQDPQHQLVKGTGAKIGSSLKVLAITAGRSQPAPLFDGEVTGLGVETDNTGTFTVIDGMDRAHRMNRERLVLSYQEQTVRDIAAMIAQRSGLTLGTLSQKTTQVRHPYLSQTHMTDWEFVQRIAELTGTVAAVEGNRLHLRDPVRANQAQASSAPYVLTLGGNLLHVGVCATASGQATQVETRAWDPQTKQPIIISTPATATDRYDVGLEPGKTANSFGAPATARVAMGTTTRTEAAAKGSAVADTLAARFITLEATVAGDPHLTTGTPVTLNNIGDEFTGRYTATAVRHSFDPHQGYRTWLRVGPPPPPSAMTAPHSPPPGHTWGLSTGIVADVQDPDKRQDGAVRLNLPWLHPDYHTDWIRTMQFGGNGGGVITPDIGDEVLVGFEHGRLDRPVVLGGLYNGRDRPSAHEAEIINSSGKVNLRSLASRSGDRLELDDTQGSRGIRLIAKKDDGEASTLYLSREDGSIRLSTPQADLELASDGGIHVSTEGPSISLVVGKSEFRLTKEGNIELSGKNVTIEADKVDINP